MTLGIPVVADPACRLHDPSAEIWVGVRTPGTETAQRYDVITAALAESGAPSVAARRCDDALLQRVHSHGLLRHLQHAYADWAAAGFPDDPGQDRVVPYVFPSPALRGSVPLREPVAVHARAGRYCYDTMTLVGPGTWDAARAAVDCAATASELVLDSGSAAYALCRPPGHHASRDGFGGSCYLNNAAVAAERLIDGGIERVAVVDIDAHHGNGTQALFYDRPDVFYASLHVDPGAGWFPHYVGFADETGAGPGAGTTLNRPLPPGTSDPVWLAALDEICAKIAAWSPGGVVLSLGVDAAADDPESPLLVTSTAYEQAGRLVAGLAVPVVAVQEGGYHLPTLGQLVVATLTGLSARE
jgi:acetoin utilization deacetylase AcuC-like enzyme